MTYFKTFSLLFMGLSVAHAMLPITEADIDRTPPLPVRRPSTLPVPTFTPRVIAAENGLEINYPFISMGEKPSRLAALGDILEENISGRHLLRLINVPFDAERALQLQYLLKNNPPLKHLEFKCCTVKDYATLFPKTWALLSENKNLDVSIIIGPPEEEFTPPEFPSLKDGHHEFASMLGRISGLNVRKSSIYEDLTIDMRAFPLEGAAEKFLKIQDGTKKVTIKNMIFDAEDVYRLLHFLEKAHPLSSSNPFFLTSVRTLILERCGIKNYTALAAFTNAQEKWANLNLEVTILRFSGQQKAFPLSESLEDSCEHLSRFFSTLKRSSPSVGTPIS